jgi:hypothetical protein
MFGRQDQHPWTNLEIDSARLAPPTAAEVGGWAASQRVFVSSVMTMRDERAAAIAAIENLGATPVAWERQIAPAPVPAEAAWLGGVDSSTILIALLSTVYGTRTHTGNSATHEEFLHAETIGIDRRVYVDASAAPRLRDGALERWLADLRPFYGYYSYRDAADLAASVRLFLNELAAYGLYRWIKVGHLVIRADRHRLTAPGSAWSGSATGTLHIEGQVTNPGLRASLSVMSQRRDRVPVVIDGQLFTGSFESVVETSERGQVGYIADLRLEAPQLESGLMWASYSVGGRTWSPAEQADLAARQILGLTGDPGPNGAARHPIDWPAVIRSARQMPAMIEIAAGLVAVEALIRSGAFSRVTSFEARSVGPPAGLALRVRGTLSLGQGLPHSTSEVSGVVSLV